MNIKCKSLNWKLRSKLLFFDFEIYLFYILYLQVHRKIIEEEILEVENSLLHYLEFWIRHLGFDNGGLAQLARAPALHAGGHRFDSDILHEEM